MFVRRGFLMDQAGGDGGSGQGTGQQGGAGAGAGSGQQGGQAAAFDWNTTITDEGVRGWVTSKGFKDPAALAQSALNQEKLLGVPADQIIRMPKDDNADAWNAVYDRLGRPKDAKDYGLPVPEGDKGEFAATAASWFHEAGLNGKQARAVATKWNEFVAAQTKAHTEATQARDADQLKALKSEWGPQFDAAMGLVDKAAATFGIPAEGVAALKDKLGPAVTAKILHSIGSKLGVEGEFVGGEGNRGSNNFGAMTPEQAQAEIRAKRNDAAFSRRFAAGDAEARAEMKKLHKLAYPGDTVL
jgi:hypothetical protein